VTPMPTTVEVLATGAVLEGRIVFARSASDVERAVIAYGLRYLRNIGGKSGVGLGLVAIDGDLDDVPYLDWLAATMDLRERLVTLAARLERKPGKEK